MATPDAAGDFFVQLQPDSTGKFVDTLQMLVNGVSVQRQRIVLSDSNFPLNTGSVSVGGEQRVTSNPIETLLVQILIELRVLTHQLGEEGYGDNDPEAIRASFTDDLGLTAQ